jgi:hypothetical protein
MKIKITEQNDEYITIKIPTKSKRQKFIETEEEIAQKVNEVGRILTKDALKKLDEVEKVVKRDKEELVLKGKKKEL